MTRLSTREWVGMLVAAAWGALLGVLPGTPFTVALLGPPVAYLKMRQRPLLSWQIPILAAAISGALMERDPNSPYTEGPVWPIILLVWVVTSAFSVPWPYIFQRRLLSDREKPASVVKVAKMSLGIGFLVFLACGLILLGFALCLWPTASEPHASLFDQWLGFLIITVGIALAIYICRNAKTLGLNYEIESLFGWILAFPALSFFFAIVLDLWNKFHRAPPAPNSTPSDAPLEVYAASLEAVAVVVWLLRRGRRMRRADEKTAARNSA